MKYSKRKNRSGALTVEFALTAPIVFLLFFAAFEFSRMNMVRHTTDVAAYEGARRGMIPGATADDVEDRARSILRSIGVDNGSVAIAPVTITNKTPEVKVTVGVSLNDVSWVTPHFLRNKQVIRSCTLRRETF